MLWEFIELPPFDELRDALFSDDVFLELQRFLIDHPQAGVVIPGTGGCRKLRWSSKGKGKRGGARVIYFLRNTAGQIVLVAAYGKGERDDVPRPWLKKIKEVLTVSKAKEAVRRFVETIEEGGKVEWARKTRFIPQPDGSMRRLVLRKDGTVEKDEIIPSDRALVAEARAKTGLSQDKFAALLGISARTLRDWEQGRRSPSGAAKTLLRIAAKHPEVLREVA